MRGRVYHPQPGGSRLFGRRFGSVVGYSVGCVRSASAHRVRNAHRVVRMSGLKGVRKVRSGLDVLTWRTISISLPLGAPCWRRSSLSHILDGALATAFRCRIVPGTHLHHAEVAELADAPA